MSISAWSIAALTHRDLAIMELVYTHGGVTADAVRRRHFTTLGARSACYARIQKLVAAGYLNRHRLPASNGIGSGKAFLTIGPSARPILAQALGLSRTELARSTRARAPGFILHHLSVSDFRLSLELACAQSPTCTLLEWTDETELRRSPIRVKDPAGKNGELLPLIPDGAFTLVLADGTEQDFHLEVDLATLAPKRLRTKLSLYLHHGRKSPTPVLWVVPSTQRQQQVARYGLEEARKVSADPTIFWVTTQANIAEHTILTSPVWQVVGGPSAISLAPVTSPLPEVPLEPAYAGNGFTLIGDSAE